MTGKLELMAEPKQIQASFQEADAQADQFLTKAMGLFQNSFDNYNNQIEPISKTYKTLSEQISKLEFKAIEQEVQVINDGIQWNDVRDHLSKRLDQLVEKTSSLSERITLEENRRLQLRADLAEMQKNQTQVIVISHNGLESKCKATAERKVEAENRQATAMKQYNTLNTAIESTQKELTELTRRYNGHGHYFYTPVTSLTSGPLK